MENERTVKLTWALVNAADLNLDEVEIFLIDKITRRNFLDF